MRCQERGCGSHQTWSGVTCKPKGLSVCDTSCLFPARDKRQHQWEAVDRFLFHTEHLQSLGPHEKIKNKQTNRKQLKVWQRLKKGGFLLHFYSVKTHFTSKDKNANRRFYIPKERAFNEQPLYFVIHLSWF